MESFCTENPFYEEVGIDVLGASDGSDLASSVMSTPSPLNPLYFVDEPQISLSMETLIDNQEFSEDSSSNSFFLQVNSLNFSDLQQSPPFQDFQSPTPLVMSPPPTSPPTPSPQAIASAVSAVSSAAAAVVQPAMSFFPAPLNALPSTANWAHDFSLAPAPVSSPPADQSSSPSSSTLSPSPSPSPPPPPRRRQTLKCRTVQRRKDQRPTDHYDEMEKVNQELVVARAKPHPDAKEISDLTEKKRAIKNRISALESRVRTKTKLAELQLENKNLTTKIEQISAECTKLKTELLEVKARKSALEAENKAFRAQISQKQSTLLESAQISHSRVVPTCITNTNTANTNTASTSTTTLSSAARGSLVLGALFAVVFIFSFGGPFSSIRVESNLPVVPVSSTPYQPQKEAITVFQALNETIRENLDSTSQQSGLFPPKMEQCVFKFSDPITETSFDSFSSPIPDPTSNLNFATDDAHPPESPSQPPASTALSPEDSSFTSPDTINNHNQIKYLPQISDASSFNAISVSNIKDAVSSDDNNSLDTSFHPDLLQSHERKFRHSTLSVGQNQSSTNNEVAGRLLASLPEPPVDSMVLVCQASFAVAQKASSNISKIDVIVLGTNPLFSGFSSDCSKDLEHVLQLPSVPISEIKTYSLPPVQQDSAGATPVPSPSPPPPPMPQ